MTGMDDTALSKGHQRKLAALRKSVGNRIADEAFSKWLKTQLDNKPEDKPDPVAQEIEAALAPLAASKINLGTYGYTIRRSKGKSAAGFVITKNSKGA